MWWARINNKRYTGVYWVYELKFAVWAEKALFASVIISAVNRPISKSFHIFKNYLIIHYTDVTHESTVSHPITLKTVIRYLNRERWHHNRYMSTAFHISK